MDLLQSLNRDRGLTLILVTHEEDVAAYAGRVLRMRDGQVLSDTRQEPATGAPPGHDEVEEGGHDREYRATARRHPRGDARSSGRPARRATPPPERGCSRSRRVTTAPAGTGLVQARATLEHRPGGITTNKARTVLTLLGIVIGVASVITAVGIGAGRRPRSTPRSAAWAPICVTVQPGGTFSGGVRGGAGSANTLTQSDVIALRRRRCRAAPCPMSPGRAGGDTSVQVVAGKNNTAAPADGVTPDILTARDYQVAVGRFITAGRRGAARARSADLGVTLAEELFPAGLGNAIGCTVQLNGQAYQVIGIMAAQGRLRQHRQRRLRPHHGRAEAPLAAGRRGQHRQRHQSGGDRNGHDRCGAGRGGEPAAAPAPAHPPRPTTSRSSARHRSSRRRRT